MDEQGRLTTAGVLFFGRRPQQFFPVFVIKAVWFYGNSIAGTQYRDSRDIEGTIPEMYEQGLRWLQSCLRRTQNGQSFNSIGKLEIPETVLEELLQNALVHLDLLKTAAIRLLIFDDRVEIINPGSVVGGHTMEEVMHGNSFPRNPLMANFCAKTMPYRGLGSGIPRVLKEDSDVQFVDNKGGNQFTAIIKRPVLSGADNTTTVIVKDGGLNGGKVGGLQLTERQRNIIDIIRRFGGKDGGLKVDDIVIKTKIGKRTIERELAFLREQGIVRRLEGRQKGYYEIIE